MGWEFTVDFIQSDAPFIELMSDSLTVPHICLRDTGGTVQI